MSQRIVGALIQIAALSAILVIWECAIRLTPGTLVPSPVQGLIALLELTEEGSLHTDLFASLSRVSIGFAFAVFCGLLVGFLLGLVPYLKKPIMGVFELLRPIPPIAWIPMAVALLGIGDPSAWFVIFVGAFFPLLTNTLLGVSSVEKLHLEAARILGASGMRSFWHVVWPSTLPSIFAGLRVGLGFAWMCVVAAEMFASRSGLGYQIQLNRQLFRLDRVLAGMLTIAIVGFVMSRLVTFVEWVFIPWRRGQIARDFFEGVSVTRAQAPVGHRRGQPDALVHNGESASTNSIMPDWKPASGASITLRDLHFSYLGSQPVIKGLNLSVKAGEVFCVLGTSGCGKSTLLRLLAGLETETAGTISIQGERTQGHRTDVTMVFQNFSLFPWRTVAGNVRFAIEQRGADKDQQDQEVEMMLQLVGLRHKAKDYPRLLSGGQMQRVAFARALACHPRVLLLDEPFSALDSYTREILQEETARLFSNSGVTVVMVTHDIAEAIFMADRIAIMDPRGGHLVEEHIVKAPRPRERSFRNTREFRELAELLALQMHPKEREEEIVA